MVFSLICLNTNLLENIYKKETNKNMACSYSIYGLASDCGTSMGGIKRVWISTVEPTITVNNAYRQITSIKGGCWRSYYFKKNTGSMTMTLNKENTTGTNFVSTEVVL